MRRTWLVAAFIFPLAGCNAIGRILPQYQKDRPADGPVAPSHLAGFTFVDRQGFAPFDSVGKLVIVKVRRTGEGWHTCNKYEAKIATTGTGGVFFQDICFPTFNGDGDLVSIVLTGKPVAPKGTEYDIQSVER